MEVATLVDDAFVNKKEYQVPENPFQLTQMAIRAHLPELTSTEKLVLICLADRTSGGRSEFMCFPSIDCIQSETNLGRRAVQKALKRLHETGFIDRRARTDNTSIYTIKYDKLKGRMTCARGRMRCTPRGERGAPYKNKGKEQTKEQTLSPQTPLSGGVRYDNLEQAIADVCHEDKSMNPKQVKRAAAYCRSIGVDATTVAKLPDYLYNECWGEYTGPIRIRHVESFVGDLV